MNNKITTAQMRAWQDYCHKYDLLSYSHTTRLQAWYDFCKEQDINPTVRWT